MAGLYPEHALQVKQRGYSNTAIDGKTTRGSGRNGQRAKHVITAFASEACLVLGQLGVTEMSNEISEIPRLLELFRVKNCTVTVDAMGTQKEIVSKITQGDGDYIMALKRTTLTCWMIFATTCKRRSCPRVQPLSEQRKVIMMRKREITAG